MEIDSKPEEMDRLDRKIIQLKIEIEALKKDSDIESEKRKDELEKNLSKLTEEYQSLEKVWVSEKNKVAGAKNLKSKLEQAKQENPYYFHILPWHLSEFFKERLKEFLSNGGKFIVPMPKFNIISNN